MESRAASYSLLQLDHRYLNVWMLDDGNYAVAYQGADVKDGSGLLGVFGKGQSFELACANYMLRIRGKTLVFDAGSENRKEVFVM